MPNTLLHKAVCALAGHCDGAASRDHQGFNGSDSYFGRKMAARPLAEWTPWQTYSIYRRLKKYEKQLAVYGIPYREIPAPPIPVKKAGPPRVMKILPDNTVGLFFEFNPTILAIVKDVPGRKWDAEGKLWSVPLNLEALTKIVEIAADYEFDVEDGILEMIETLHGQHHESVEASRASDAELVVKGLRGELLPFQKAGIKYGLAKKRFLIGDEMGLGKTIQAIGYAQATKGFQAIVVCPASLKLNWKKEFEKWIPKIDVAVIDGDPIRYSAHDVLIINYDILKKHLEFDEKVVRGKKKIVVRPGAKLLSGKPRTLILDESHYAKNPKAKRTEFLLQMTAGIEHIVLLSGTSILSRPIELASQLQILGRLEEFGGWWKFAHRYAGAFRTSFGLDTSGATNLEELNLKLRATCYVRRLKSDVLKELPAKRRSLVSVEIANRSEYDKAAADFIDWLENQAELEDDFLDSIAEYSADEQKEAIREYRATKAEKAALAEHLVKIEGLKQLSALGKREAAKEWIESFLETDQKLVIFAHHKAVVRAIVADFPGTPQITGDTPSEERQKAVDRFQTDPGCRLIVLNIRAGGVGITLTAASNVLFLELDWTPAAHDQAEDRCHRIGQRSSVNAWYLMGSGTIDEDIYELIEAKREVVNATIEGGGGANDRGIMKELIGRLKHRRELVR